MTWATFDYFWLGVLGGALVDGMEFVNAVRSNAGKVPIKFKRFGYVLGEAVRLAAGGALAAVFFASHQITTPFAAITVGIAAPIIIDRLARQEP